MTLLKKIIIWFYKLSAFKNKILLINAGNKYSLFDQFLLKNLKKIDPEICICKAVDLNAEVDYGKYPADIELVSYYSFSFYKSLFNSKIILDFKLSKEYSKHSIDQFIISIPGEEINNLNYIDGIKSSKIQRNLDFCIARDIKKSEKLSKIFSNRVQILNYGDPLFFSGRVGKPFERLVKLIELILRSNDRKRFNLFRRLNIKKSRYEYIALWHNYLSFLYIINNRLLKRHININYISPMKVKYMSFYKRIFYYFPIKRNRIVLRNFQHKYGDNPKYITEELIKRNELYDIVWIVDLKKSLRSSYPEKVRVVQNNTFLSWYYLYTAKVWVDNNVRIVNPSKKKSQYYIQTWHGSLGIKKFDNVWTPSVVAENNRITDFCISNSRFETEVYKTTVWKNVVVKEFGHPRNDIFFSGGKNKEIIKRKLMKYIGVDENCSIILYAPTFRDNHLSSNDKDLSMYLSQFDLLIDACESRFGNNWILLKRLHYHSNTVSEVYASREKVFDVSAYDDMQELIFCADLAITDYSSWIYDFILMGKPGFIFAADEVDYLKEREFYFPLRDTPFPVSKSIQELLDQINKFDNYSFKLKCDQFLTEKGCIEDGSASKRVVDLINRLMMLND